MIPPFNGFIAVLIALLIVGIRWCLSPAGKAWLDGPPRDQAFASETDGTSWTPGGRP